MERETFLFTARKAKKSGHFRELLTETDGDVGQGVERPQLREHPLYKDIPQRVMRTVCPKRII